MVLPLVTKSTCSDNEILSLGYEVLTAANNFFSVCFFSVCELADKLMA